MWRLSMSTAKVAGAAATGFVFFAVSSCQSLSISTDNRQNHDGEPSAKLTFLKPRCAKCAVTSDQTTVDSYYGILPSVRKIPSPSSSKDEGAASFQQPGPPTLKGAFHGPSSSLSGTIAQCRRLIRRAMMEKGIPGAVVAVMKDGQLVWSEGMGYADVENDVPCTPENSMRIASISKPLTVVALLQLWEKGLIDLDAPIQKYVPEFPEKEHEGKRAVITTRQLLSHISGIRHYSKKEHKDESNTGKAVKEFDQREYYIASHYHSVFDALKLFAEDELLCKPGSEYHYTTHGWTLISAIIEKVSDKKFLDYMKDHVFKPLAMTSTRGEYHQPLIYSRAKHYVRGKGGLLRNTPYVDVSYKWAGGGFISNAEDLTRFGNALLTCYQLGTDQGQPPASDSESSNQSPPSKGNQMLHGQPQSQVKDRTNFVDKCFLKPDTISMMWTPVVVPNKLKPEIGYGMGWVVREESVCMVGGKEKPFYAAHSGGSVGATSILVVIPSKVGNINAAGTKPAELHTANNMCSEKFQHNCECNSMSCKVSMVAPRGVVVAVLFNLQEVTGVTDLGVKIAEQFLDWSNH